MTKLHLEISPKWFSHVKQLRPDSIMPKALVLGTFGNSNRPTKFGADAGDNRNFKSHLYEANRRVLF